MTTLPDDHHERMTRVAVTVAGVSLGDALGDWFFWPQRYPIAERASRTLPKAPWRVTDDTIMSLAVAAVLDKHGKIQEDALALELSNRFWADVHRGYGSGAVEILEAIHSGVHWKIAAGSAFGGTGSMGNGGAMRATPVGAYFAGDPARIVDEAYRSASVTHAHREGQVGAAAVALAASYAVQSHTTNGGEDSLLKFVVGHLPRSEVREGLLRAVDVPVSTSTARAAEILGDGGRITAQDTAPFALWSASKYFSNFEEAVWSTAAVGGDCDTTSAIVGGIVSLAVGLEQLPSEWLKRREPLS